MTNTTTTSSSDSYFNCVKAAGFFYFIIIPLSLIPSQLVSATSIFKADSPFQAMAEYGHLYHIGTAIEFIMYISVMFLSCLLYTVLKPVNKELAQIGFAFRFGEAVLGCVAIIFYILSIMWIDNLAYLQVFTEQQQAAIGLFFLKASAGIYYVLLTIMGIGATIYCYLFYTSKLVPKALAGWGIFTYVTMTVYGVMNIAYADTPSELKYMMAPGALFEMTMGLWLMFKGVNREKLMVLKNS